MVSSSINVEVLSEHNDFYEKIQDAINFDKCSDEDYLTILKTVQKTVNTVLTQLVEKEKLQECLEDNMEEEDDDDDDDTKENDTDIVSPISNSKRKVDCDNNSKKMKS